MRFLSLSLSILIAACGSSDPITVDASLLPSVSATASPTTIAPGGTVVLTVTTTNFAIINPMTAGPKPGEGHYHYYLDDAVNYVAAWTPTVGVRMPTNAAPGVHMVRLVLVSSDHIDVNPPVATEVTFVVQ